MPACPFRDAAYLGAAWVHKYSNDAVEKGHVKRGAKVENPFHGKSFVG